MPRKARSFEQTLRRQHEQGDADATLMLGQYLITGGRGVVPDPQEGINLLYRLAINPFCPGADTAGAKYVLGEVYRLGLGVERDPPRSIEWYENALRCGLLTGAHYVGWWYTGLLPNWRAERPDLELAASYFKIGADEGCAECAAGLAMLHLEGLLPNPDQELGLLMLRAAAKSGHPIALGALKRAGPAFASDQSGQCNRRTAGAAPNHVA